MTQPRAMVGLGLCLLVLTVLVAVLAGLASPDTLGGLTGLAGLSAIDPDGAGVARQTSGAAMADLSVLGAAAIGQAVLGLVVGLVLASRVGAPLRGLVASMRVVSVFLLTVFGLVLLRAFDAESLGAVDPRVITAALLALASWPMAAMAVCAAADLLASTAYFASARELGVNAVTRCIQHVLPGLWRPLLAAVAVGAIHMMGALFTLGFLGVATPGGAPGLGGLLRRGFDGFDPSAPAGLLIPAAAMTMILLAFVLLREGLRE
ncbi:MAG: ABC transporter permease subunit [Pseudomonadota bacterium]